MNTVMGSKYKIYGNDIPEYVFEGFLDISNALDGTGREKKELFSFAMEAVSPDSNVTFATRSKLVQSLYEKTIATAKVDFGDIPQSKGNITRLSEFKVLEDVHDRINDLTEYPKKNNEVEALVLMNNLYNILFERRNDFEWGFKVDNDVIKIIYNTGVMTLFQLININILIYIDFLKNDSPTLEMSAKKPRPSDYVINAAKNFNDIFTKGEFDKIVKECKKNLHATVMDSTTTVPEEILDSIETDAMEAGFFNKTVTNIAAGLAPKSIIGGIRAFMFSHPVLFGLGAGIIAIVGIFFAIRKLISVFYHSSIKVSDCTAQWGEFIKSTEKTTDSDKTTKRKSFAYEKLMKIHNFIETKIFKGASGAQKSEMEINKELASNINDLRSDPIFTKDTNTEDTSDYQPDNNAVFF